MVREEGEQRPLNREGSYQPRARNVNYDRNDCGGCNGCGNCLVVGDCGEAGIIIAGFILVVGGVIAAGFAAWYALQKAYKSFSNLVDGKKSLRSFFRIAGIAGGAYGGAIAGGLIGTSAFPGIGTVIGVICGIALGAGIGAFISKHVGRLISALFNSREFNPSNPAKYKLTTKQETALQGRGYNTEAIHQALQEIYYEKRKTSDMDDKQTLNTEIINIKQDRYDSFKLGERNFIFRAPAVRVGEGSPGVGIVDSRAEGQLVSVPMI